MFGTPHLILVFEFCSVELGKEVRATLHLLDNPIGSVPFMGKELAPLDLQYIDCKQGLVYWKREGCVANLGNSRVFYFIETV